MIRWFWQRKPVEAPTASPPAAVAPLLDPSPTNVLVHGAFIERLLKFEDHGIKIVDIRRDPQYPNTFKFFLAGENLPVGACVVHMRREEGKDYLVDIKAARPYAGDLTF